MSELSEHEKRFNELLTKIAHRAGVADKLSNKNLKDWKLFKAKLLK